MDNRVFQKIRPVEQLRLREQQAKPWKDCYSEMNSIEKSIPLVTNFSLYVKWLKNMKQNFWKS